MVGMFDWIKCHCPLPREVQTAQFQTKDTPAQLLDNYEIRTDGTLWHEDYDIEDRSDPNATGLLALAGWWQVNHRWRQEKDFTGEIVFYDEVDDTWYEFSAYFVNGKLQHLEQLRPKKEN